MYSSQIAVTKDEFEDLLQHCTEPICVNCGKQITKERFENNGLCLDCETKLSSLEGGDVQAYPM